jgi:hypothetical protein
LSALLTNFVRETKDQIESDLEHKEYIRRKKEEEARLEKQRRDE